MKNIKTDNVPILSWCENLEDSAKEQLENLAKHPFVFKKVCAMPDAHTGYGMPIGGVTALKNAISPNMVGLDISCSMIYVKTDFKVDQLTEDLPAKMVHDIQRTVPMGMGQQHNQPQEWEGFDRVPDLPVFSNTLIKKAKKQLGTLGGGNHFIEIQKTSDGYLAFMIHSGSRGLGHSVAKYYIAEAVRVTDKIRNAETLPNKEHSINKKWELDVLPFVGEDSRTAHDYVRAMNFAMDYAHENIHHMMKAVMRSISILIKKELQLDHVPFPSFEDTAEENIISISHNYAAKELIDGEKVWVHRKGAIEAREGTKSVIPGSMGTASYIVEGLGNPDSFYSASHGAGRKMSRIAYNKQTTLEEAEAQMEGIAFTKFKKSRRKDIEWAVDEAPGAYKDIHDVINAQKDLIKVIDIVTPIAVAKG